MNIRNEKSKSGNPAGNGPLLEALTHRLSQCPREFLDAPRIGSQGVIRTAGVVADLMLDITGTLPALDDCREFEETAPKDKAWLRLVLVSAWLLHDRWFQERPEHAARLWNLLRKGLQSLAQVVTAEQCVLEPDRREELVRYCLNALAVVPSGETAAQAVDRLKALNSIERVRVMQEAKRAEEHARKVREAMQEKQAKEAAAKATRE